MSRTSKRRSAISANNVEPVSSEHIFKVGLYARLSIEDTRDRKDSDSIENQVFLLKEYVSDKPYLKVFSVYSDNGEKGTHFDRPEFKRLMEDVKSGAVNCIIVKDLSRFGRDYIETGNYLEKIFPFMGIRFISINDNYDNFNPNGGNEALMIALKNLLNDIYAKDISKKIISSFRERQANGDFLGAHIPYGYKRPTDGTYKLLVDEKAAEIVRKIYALKLEGNSDDRIAKELNTLGIPSPSKYKYLNGDWKNSKYNKSIWRASAIKQITENIVYLGHKVYGRELSALYEGKSRIRVPESQWTVIENDHEPIIDKDTFDIVHSKRMAVNKAQKELRAKNKGIPKSENIFQDYLFCGDCKKKLSRLRKMRSGYFYYVFVCPTHETYRGFRCSSKYITEKNICSAVYSAIKAHIELADSVQKILESTVAKKSIQSEERNIQAKIAKAQQELERTNSLLGNLFDDYLDNILSERDYLFAKQKYENIKASLQQILDELRQQLRNYQENFTASNKWLSAVDGFRNEETLSRAMITSLVECIELESDKSVTIRYKFKDEFTQLDNYLTSIGLEVKPNV